MKKFIFKYKRWYSRLILMANLLIPVFIILTEGALLKFKGISSPIVGKIQWGLILATVAAIAFVGFGLSYVLQTFKTEHLIRERLTMDKVYRRRLFLGLLLYFISLCVMLLIVAGRYFATEENASWFKNVIFVFVAITLILGVFSNINIHQFEAVNYFKIFYHRHKDEDVKEILNDMRAARKKRGSEQTGR